jgi:hypothetical protein
MDESLRVMSWADWLAFDAMAAAPAMAVPTLMAHADEAALPENARRFFAATPGPSICSGLPARRRISMIASVGLAVDVAVAHFHRTLGRPAGTATLADRQAISDAITGLLHAIDRRNWAAVRGRLAEQVRTDYTSLFGGSPQTQSAAELIESWPALVPGFESTQHLTGPILADVLDDRARARCAVTAVHRIGRGHWTPSGHYEMELVRTDNIWAIDAIVYHNALVVGDETLPEKAQARVTSMREAQTA